MVNSFIRYSPYSTSDYEKKSAMAITSIMIKVSDYNLWFVYMLMDAYTCALMIITLFLCFFSV